MSKDENNEFKRTEKELHEAIAKEVSSEISKNVQRQYKIIDLDKVPDHVNYSKVEKYIRSINIEITRRMFITYIKNDIFPSEHEVKNSNLSYYTKNQIIYYILVDMFKPILPLNKIKVLFSDILKPMIDDTGIENTYIAMCEMINYMVGRFEEAVAMAIKKENLSINEISLNVLEEKDVEKANAIYHIKNYTNFVTLCMAKGALDLYKYSPNTLLE